jgi:hypothetical protein
VRPVFLKRAQEHAEKQTAAEVAQQQRQQTEEAAQHAVPAAAKPKGQQGASGSQEQPGRGHGAERTSLGKDKEEEEWTPMLMINKKDWPFAQEPTFKDIAHYLGSEEGTVWRQKLNITTVATADELLAW